MVGLVGVTAMGGCDVDDLRPPEERPPTPSPSEEGEPEPDQALVESMATAIVRALETVAVARSFPRLQPFAAPLARTHQAHLRVLVVEGQAPTPAPVPSSAGEALTRLKAQEGRLQRELAGAAVDAQSGALARLLASMSASVAQHLAALPESLEKPKPGGGR